MALLPFLLNVVVLLFILISHASMSLAVLSSATIDDSTGDSKTGAMPEYSPPGAFTLNSNCNGCLVHADPTRAFGNSWHDSSQFGGAAPVSVTLSFSGNGIDVYCILANTIPGAVTATDLAFSLDDSPHGTYSHNPDSTSDYVYGEKVFSVENLAQGNHQLVIATDNPSGSLLLFDYARYTCVFALSSNHIVQREILASTMDPRRKILQLFQPRSLHR
ncbi:hypothetical protein C8R43DRAFT_889037 [Mycena crocata]|nr:hypothetical protein C8R43DRAFT_889037 [Mycena crocata]